MLSGSIADSNDGQTDLHLLPSQDVVEWGGIKQVLQQIRYVGKYVLEVSMRIEDWDPDRFLQMAAEFVKNNCLTSQ